MNLRFPIIISLLAAGLVAQTAGTIAQEAQSVPAEIVLNGVMTASDARRAFFRAAFTPGAPKVDFMLAEGETRYGIQLLAVDARLNAVKIRNHGLVQTIPICQTPELVWSAIKASAAGVSGLTTASGRQNNRPVQAEVSLEEANANPLMSVAGVSLAAGSPRSINNGSSSNGSSSNGSSSNGSSSNGGSNNEGSNNDGSNNDGTPSTADAGSGNSNGSTFESQDHRYQWWIQEAQKIEQARIETAQRVLAGEWQPYPLTPLTPSGTSPQLIGPSSVFMEHGLGVIVAGS
jgi:hypothetical protein